MNSSWKDIYRDKLQGFNYLLFLLMILALPTHESPKFIFWSLFVLSALLLGFFIIRTLVRQWDALDSLILIWMFSGIVVAYFAGIQHKEWGGATDTIIFTSVLLILKKRCFDDTQLKMIYGTIILSTLTASLVAIWQFYNLHNMEFIEFHSVGHVNHTAIYLALSTVAMTAILYAYWAVQNNGQRLLHIAAYTTLVLTLVLTNSRAAIAATFLFLVSCLFIFSKQRLLSIIMTAILLGLVAGNYMVNRGGVIEKQLDQVERGIFFEARSKIWRSAVLTWQQHPFFGTGIKNYGVVSIDQLMHWCKQSGKDCTEEMYMPYAHGHSLYLNTLAERGLFGLLVIMANIAVLAYLVYQHRPGPPRSNQYTMLWTGAFGVIFLNLLIGLFNTTLHHEHAMLSAIVVGLFLRNLADDQYKIEVDKEEIH